MNTIELLGYAGALVIGIVLGLIGGGGSILTLPVLVYALGINPVLATAYSLFVVGTSAAVGAVQNLRKGLVSLRTAVLFSVPAFISVYLTRRFLLPAIPTVIYSTDDFILSRSMAIMVFFAIIMVLAAVFMLREKNEDYVDTSENISVKSYLLIALEGLVVGVVTGIVGAGGGFLIIPALVLLAKLPMKKAVATSLLIIAIKSLIGFLGDVQTLTIDWRFLLPFSAVAILGIFGGMYLNKYIDGNKLKKGFGIFVAIMGVFILVREVLP